MIEAHTGRIALGHVRGGASDCKTAAVPFRRTRAIQAADKLGGFGLAVHGYDIKKVGFYRWRSAKEGCRATELEGASQRGRQGAGRSSWRHGSVKELGGEPQRMVETRDAPGGQGRLKRRRPEQPSCGLGGGATSKWLGRPTRNKGLVLVRGPAARLLHAGIDGQKTVWGDRPRPFSTPGTVSHLKRTSRPR